MTTGLHTLTRTTKRSAPRVGRGGRRGKTSGRGHKGQKAHAAHAPRPQMRDTIKKLPKKRGFGKNRARTLNSGRKIYAIVSLADINKVFSDGDTVSLETLGLKGMVGTRRERKPAIKILANGNIEKKVTVEGCSISESARKAIEKVGGKVQE